MGRFGRVLILLAGAVVAVLVAACGTAAPSSAPAEVSVLRAVGVDREAPPPDAPVEATVDGMTAFGYDLYRVSAEPGRNFVISPFSIATAFVMVRAGTRSDTAEQIDAVLRFPRNGVHAAFNAITGDLVTGSSPQPRLSPSAMTTPGQSARPALSSANGLFVQEGERLQDVFLRILASQYGAAARTVDFTSPEAIES